MKLYSYSKAPNPQRVELMLRYKGVDLDTRQIDMMSGEHLQENFQKINPRLTLPALILDDGTLLTEVIAICLYLDSQFPEKTVFGKTDIERALVVNWMHRIFVEGFLAVAEAFRNTTPGFKNRALPGPDDFEQIPALAERGFQRIDIFFRTLEDYLSGREYLVTDCVTQADIDAYVSVNFARWVKQSPPSEYVHLAAWKQRMDLQLGNG